MAYNKDIRFRCRALFEIMDMTLVEISKKEAVPISTLSEWKNDDRPLYGGIWIKGCKRKNVEQTAKKLKEELEATSVYDEMKNRIKEHNIIKGDKLEFQSIEIDNQELQAEVETEITLLSTIMPDWFDSAMLRNALYSKMLIERKMKKNPDSVKQTDLKMSSETIRMAKESRFGKTPDTVIFNANGEYTKEELAELSVEEIEKLYLAEQKRILQLDDKNIHSNDTHNDT